MRTTKPNARRGARSQSEGWRQPLPPPHPPHASRDVRVRPERLPIVLYHNPCLEQQTNIIAKASD